jgi:sigma-E factor negative regulatory protein RseC
MMLEESGRVISLEGEDVWVETIRQSACAGCSASKGCGQKLIAGLGQGQRFQVKAKNPGALLIKAEDQVVLGLPGSSFLNLSVLVYLTPLVGLMMGALAADLVAASDGLTAIAGLLGFGLGLMLVRWVGKRIEHQCRYQPVVLRMVSRVGVMESSAIPIMEQKPESVGRERGH